jgi:hypothetical protein
MIRLLVLLFNMIGVFFITNIFDGGVSLKVSVPNEVVAGTDLRVQVTLTKGNLSGFSRFQQDLPAGLSASSENSAFGDFSFNEKKIRLMWLRLPAQNEVTFTYTIKIDQRLKGNFTLGGKFSYIENNQRKFIDVEPVSVNISPSPSIDPSLVVDIKDFEKQVIPDLSNKSYNGIICIRQKPFKVKETGDIIVNLLVGKPANEKYAKIEERIPSGYKASLIEGKDAIFSSNDSLVKFLWVTPPAENYYLVSYKLSPINNSSIDSLDISGTYSYIEAERTFNLDVVEQNINLIGLKKEEVNNLVVNVNKQKKLQILANNNSSKNNTSSDKTNPKSNTNTPIVKKKSGEEQFNKNIAVNNSKLRIPEELHTTDLLKPDTGIYYRIQVAAGHQSIDVKRYFKKYKLEEKVLAEDHNGWKKYSVGSYRIYKEARDYRTHIWNTTSINDAFVSAYNNGSRITVQEALMVGNQKWYK